MLTRIFVFGTLKEGFPNFATNRGRRVEGEFQTCQRLPLYLVGERFSPWLIDQPGEGFQVAGQVFEVDAATLALMDQLERTHEPDGYVRQTINVQDRFAARILAGACGLVPEPDGLSGLGHSDPGNRNSGRRNGPSQHLLMQR